MRALILCLAVLAVAERASAADVWFPSIQGFGGPIAGGDPEQPSIKDPGPDTADFPDSAFTVKPGVLYVETALTYTSSKDSPQVRSYETPTLLRYGVTERFELRLGGSFIHEHADDSRSGVAPLAFGFKRHFWDENPDAFLPAFGIIGVVVVPTSSAGFDSGVAEPTLYFNFDYTLTERLEFEWNGGIGCLENDDGQTFLQGQYLWSVARTWGREGNLKTFFHGVALFPGESGSDTDVVMGPGYVLFRGNRLALDGSYNFGVTGSSPHRLIRLGMSMAF